MGTKPPVFEITRLIDALRSEKIRFILAGMSAAVLHGVPGSTINTDIWIDLPQRSYLRLHKIIGNINGSMITKTAGFLEDDTLINFLFEVDGLRSFTAEWNHSKKLKFGGRFVPVLPLKRILKSKETLQRSKDLVHIQLIKQTLRLK
ncbi:MAG: hypothetical protein AAF558_12810 [Verrucomicrobiota bacterium]